MAFTLWEDPDANRLAISLAPNVGPVAGHVLKNEDDSWSLACGRTRRPERHATANAAACSLVALARPGEERFFVEALDGKLIHLGVNADPFFICVDGLHLNENHTADLVGRLLGPDESAFVFKNLPATYLMPEFYERFTANLENRVQPELPAVVQIDFLS